MAAKVKKEPVGLELEEDDRWYPEELLTVGAVRAPVRIAEKSCSALISQGFALRFTPRERITKTGVFQDLEGCDDFTGAPLFSELHQATVLLLEKLLDERFAFTDVSLQRYSKSSPGQEYAISPHLDQKACTGVVAVWLLCGESQFYVCANRQGERPQLIHAEPGELILMRGYGFRGNFERPFHFVGKLRGRRLTFGLRQTGGKKL